MRSVSTCDSEVTMVAWSDSEDVRGLARPAQRRGLMRRVVRRTLLAVLFTGVVAGVAAPVWLWKSGRLQTLHQALHHRFVQGSAEAGLAVDEVLLIGRAQAPRAILAEALGIERGTPMFGIAPDETRQRLESVPWVRSATVARRLPATIIVRLEEFEPFALWQHEGRFALVDRDGIPFIVDDGAPAAHEAIARFSSLPLVVGAGAPQSAPPLLGALADYPDIAVRLRAAVRVGARRWDLMLDPDIRVALPEADWREALQRLSDMQQDEQLLDRAVAEIDLRLPDRVVLMPAGSGDDHPRKDRKGGRA